MGHRLARTVTLQRRETNVTSPMSSQTFCQRRLPDPGTGGDPKQSCHLVECSRGSGDGDCETFQNSILKRWKVRRKRAPGVCTEVLWRLCLNTVCTYRGKVPRTRQKTTTGQYKLSNAHSCHGTGRSWLSNRPEWRDLVKQTQEVLDFSSWDQPATTELRLLNLS